MTQFEVVEDVPQIQVHALLRVLTAYLEAEDAGIVVEEDAAGETGAIALGKVSWRWTQAFGTETPPRTPSWRPSWASARGGATVGSKRAVRATKTKGVVRID
jgi:hypothetical protein